MVRIYNGSAELMDDLNVSFPTFFSSMILYLINIAIRLCMTLTLIIDGWIFHQNNFLTIFDTHMDDYLKKFKYLKICYNRTDRFYFFNIVILCLFSIFLFLQMYHSGQELLQLPVKKNLSLAFTAVLLSPARQCKTTEYQNIKLY